ncbi:MAG TPA: hypothetical protein VG297_20040 [Bryobacteraceae bacterium]|jgi:hypothetical protein|nr:hypothetical protein [Bryobacteraceae bacterium]
MIALTGLLAVTLGAIVWQGHSFWSDAQAKRNATLNAKAAPITAPPVTPAPKPATPPAIKYADVATKNLFAKDRNPTVVIDPPAKVEEKKMPPLPIVYGVLGLPSGTKALMAEKRGEASHPVQAGDTIGEFKIASLDPRTVVFDWNDRQIPKKIDDLIDRSEEAAPAGASAAQPRVAATPNPPPQNNTPVAAAPGNDTGAGTRACVPGDKSPAGTVADGYRKLSTPTPFGSMCSWVKQ